MSGLVAHRREPSTRFAEIADAGDHLIDRLGILGLPITDEVAQYVSNLRLPSGVVVAASNRPPAPWGDRLQSGDVIYTVDEHRVTGPADLRSVLRSKKATLRVFVHLLRDGRMRYLVLPVQ